MKLSNGEIARRMQQGLNSILETNSYVLAVLARLEQDQALSVDSI